MGQEYQNEGFGSRRYDRIKIGSIEKSKAPTGPHVKSEVEREHNRAGRGRITNFSAHEDVGLLVQAYGEFYDGVVVEERAFDVSGREYAGGIALYIEGTEVPSNKYDAYLRYQELVAERDQ